MEYYNARQAAPPLQVCERTVRTWIESGKIMAEKVGRSFRIPQSEIDRLKTEGSGKETARENVETGKEKAEKRKMESGKLIMSAEWLANLKGDVEGLKGVVGQMDKRLGRFEVEFWVGWVTLVGMLVGILLKL